MFGAANSQLSEGLGRYRQRSLGAGIAAALGAMLMTSPASTRAQEAEKAMQLEEVVVTAARRGEQKLVDTPLAISAYDGTWLEDRGYLGLKDFIQLSPGVSMTEYVPGQSRIQMRGISASVGEANIGYYLDEVPVAFINQNNLPDLRAFDMERIEVLRGPQSTLYGAGALAGVVRSVTQTPSMSSYEFKADMTTSATNDGGANHAGNFAANIPLVEDRLGLRMVYLREDNSGWVDQTLMDRRNYNGNDLESMRVKLLGQVTDKLTVSAMYWGSRIDSRGAPTSFSDRTLDEVGDTASEFDYDIYNVTFNYDGDTFGLVSSTSHMGLDNVAKSDFIMGATLDTILNPRAFTQEVRAFSRGDGAWQWSAGAFYRNADQTQVQTSVVMPSLGINPVIQYDKVTSKSVFAELTRSFMDGRLDVTGGARLLTETRSSEQRLRPSDPYANKFNAVTPRVNVTYRPASNWMTYFNFSQGFRSGINQFPVSLETAASLGVILPTAAEPEYADSYEVGVKGSFFDNRLTVDVASYYIKWRDMQTIVPIVAGALYGVVNASSASSPGMEWSVNWRATDKLRLGVMGSWNDAQINQDVYAQAQELDPVTRLPTGGIVPTLVFNKGDRINDVPEWTGGLTVDYARPISGDLRFVIHGTTQYASRRETRSYGAGVSGDTIVTTDLRLGVETGRWAAHLFGTNLFDEKGIVSPISSATRSDFGYRNRPRTIGLNLKYFY